MQIPSRFVPSVESRARHGDALDRLAPFLLAADPLADAAIVAITERGAEGKALLDALANARLPNHAPGAVRALRDHLEHVPLWVDWDRAEAGARVLLASGLLTGLTLAAKSIVLGYASPGGNKPLALSGALTQRAPRRLNETSRYVRAVLLPRGLAPGSEGYALTVRVRLMHARVRQLALRDVRWNTAAYGVPINQHDMAATTLLFSEMLLQGLETLGVPIRAAEGDAVTHLWRYAGHLMGVDTELLPTSRKEAQRLTALIDESQGPPDDDSRKLTRALFEVPYLEIDMAPKGERAAAERIAYRSRELLRVAAYELLGKPLSVQLGIEPSPWRGALPMLRRLVRTTSLVARNVPALESRAIEAGRRYWDTVREQGLLRYDAGFLLPERLA
jgi:hypothetical protein